MIFQAKVVLPGLLLWAWACVGTAATIANEPGTDFFSDQAPIRSLAIVITQTNQIELFKDPRAYVSVEIREGDRLYTNVALHLKGNEGGSFRPLHEKPAMTVNFDKFQQGQLFHGLDKIYLNNSVEDDSYSAEMLGSELFRAAGVPAPRIGYARVSLNGRDCGLYVIKEGFNKRFLRRYFRDVDGNFYDGGFITDIDENLIRSSGSGPPDNADLDALAAAAKEFDPVQRWQRLQKVLDVDRFISFMAMEVMAGHWDGYTMNRNNYRIYHDPTTDKLIFFPHGMDIMFSDPDSSLEPYMDGLVSRAILGTREGQRRYRERAREFATNIFKLDVLTNRIEQLYDQLQPVLASVSTKAAVDHIAGVQKLRDAVIQRTTNLAEAIRFTPPAPLVFDASGVAPLSNWSADDGSDQVTLEQVTVDGSVQALHIRVKPSVSTLASWRTRATVSPGRYLMFARVKTVGIVPVISRPGDGAGIRVGSVPRSQNLTGNTPWTEVKTEFVIEHEPEAAEFVCELGAKQGSAWFDLNSLKVLRLAK